jgi:hypothetical protein
MPEAVAFLQERALTPFLEEVKAERVSEVERIRHHVELALSELIGRADDDIGRYADEKDRNLEGAAGRLAIAIEKHDQLCRRREQRREELDRQQALSLQAVERIASALVLPHPERGKPELRNLRPSPETEQTAMRVEGDSADGALLMAAMMFGGVGIFAADLPSGALRIGDEIFWIAERDAAVASEALGAFGDEHHVRAMFEDCAGGADGIANTLESRHGSGTKSRTIHDDGVALDAAVKVEMGAKTGVEDGLVFEHDDRGFHGV